jgi:hypothetical protein
VGICQFRNCMTIVPFGARWCMSHLPEKWLRESGAGQGQTVKSGTVEHPVALLQLHVAESKTAPGTQNVPSPLATKKHVESGKQSTPTRTPPGLEQGTESTGAISPPKQSCITIPETWNDEESAGKKLMQEPENGIVKTQNYSEPKSVPEESDAIQPDGSLLPEAISKEVRSRSINLTRRTAQHLFDLMQSLGTEETGDDVRPRPISAQTRVMQTNAACNCASNITKLMRFQLDVVKEARKKYD